MKKDLITIYRNYLFAVKEREEYGDKYGDTDELMEYYEEVLNIKTSKDLKLERKIKKDV